jgi:hypothetical protein
MLPQVSWQSSTKTLSLCMMIRTLYYSGSSLFCDELKSEVYVHIDLYTRDATKFS